MSLIEEFDAYRNLKDDWDGEGAIRPRAECIDLAVRLCAHTTADSPAESMLHAYGTVAFFWRTPHYAEIECLSEGRVSYYIEHPSGDRKGIAKETELPPAVLEQFGVGSAPTVGEK